jgi:hypothetical protein
VVSRNSLTGFPDALFFDFDPFALVDTWFLLWYQTARWRTISTYSIAGFATKLYFYRNGSWNAPISLRPAMQTAPVPLLLFPFGEQTFPRLLFSELSLDVSAPGCPFNSEPPDQLPAIS